MTKMIRQHHDELTLTLRAICYIQCLDVVFRWWISIL